MDDLGAEAADHPLGVWVEGLGDYLPNGIVEELFGVGFYDLDMLENVRGPRDVLGHYVLWFHRLIESNIVYYLGR